MDGGGNWNTPTKQLAFDKGTDSNLSRAVFRVLMIVKTRIPEENPTRFVFK